MLGSINQANTTEDLVFGPIILTADHITGATGKALTVTIGKNGGAFAVPIGAVSEVGNGIYKIAASSADASTIGRLQIHATAAACDPYDEAYDVVEAPTTVTLAAALAPTIGTTTGYSLIIAALKTLNVLDPQETPTAAEAVDALARLNDLIDSFATQDLTIYFLLRTLKVLASGTASYSIGVGGSINIVRPTAIAQAGIILDTTQTPPLEVPIDVYTDQQWMAITMKTYQATYPNGIYYDYNSAAGLGLVYPFPIPNQALTQLVLYTPQALTEMTLAGALTFPPGYRRLLRYALARDLSAEFGGWDGGKQTIYEDAIQNIKNKNLRMSDLTIDFALTGGPRSNIYTGQA